MLEESNMNENQKKAYKKLCEAFAFTIGKPNSDIYVDYLFKIADKEFFKNYIFIINETIKLFKKLELTDPIEISLAFEYLLWNGYFSKDKTLIYEPEVQYNIPIAQGADVINGKSVCINNAEMLTRILKKMGFSAFIVPCYLKTKVSKNLTYKPNISRNQKSKLNFNPISAINNIVATKIVGNHACTLVKNKNKYIICDPTNLGFLYFNDLLKAKFACGNIEVKIYPHMLSKINGINNDQTVKLFEDSFKSIKESKLTDKEVIEKSEKIISLCENNIDLFDMFHEKCKENIENVHKSLKKEKK